MIRHRLPALLPLLFLLFALPLAARWAVANGVDLAAGAADWSPALRFLADTRAVQLGLLNPAVTATYGLIASAVVGALGVAFARREAAVTASEAA